MAKTPVVACFVDLRGAFAKICRILLFCLLRQRLGENKILDIMEQIYKSTGGHISGTKPDDTFNISSGMRQGAVESRTAIGELESEDDFRIKIEYRISQESSTREMRSHALNNST